jgi:hypothetical protein
MPTLSELNSTQQVHTEDLRDPEVQAKYEAHRAGRAGDQVPHRARTVAVSVGPPARNAAAGDRAPGGRRPRAVTGHPGLCGVESLVVRNTGNLWGSCSYWDGAREQKHR